MRFPVHLEPEEGAVNITFPDIPEAITFGTDRKEALMHAHDALKYALDFYFDDKRPVPVPSKAKAGEEYIELPSSLAAKVLLHNELLAQKVRPADLAHRLGIPRQEVNRYLNPRHATKIDSIQNALGALGKQIQFLVSSSQVVDMRSAGIAQKAKDLRTPASGAGRQMLKDGTRHVRASKAKDSGRVTKTAADAPLRAGARKAV